MAGLPVFFASPDLAGLAETYFWAYVVTQIKDRSSIDNSRSRSSDRRRPFSVEVAANAARLTCHPAIF
jgi:hypothetical protein